MELKERIKLVRKELGLTQKEFAEKLGVTDGAISLLESAKSALTDHMRIAICREFGVNEAWLREGAGDMFIENDGTIIAALAAEFKLDDLDQDILRAYLDLSEDQRQAVKLFFRGKNGFSDRFRPFEEKSAEETPPAAPPPPFTLPFSVALPYIKEENPAKPLTEDEAVAEAEAFIRARYADAKKGSPSSMEFMREDFTAPSVDIPAAKTNQSRAKRKMANG